MSAATTRKTNARLMVAIVLTLAVFAGELAGGLAANSLALVSDAGHVFTDLVALGLAWVGVRQTQRRPSQRMTFGYHRTGILLAVVNAMLLLGVTVTIFIEAAARLREPGEVEGGLVLVIAVLGLAVNTVVLLTLRGEGGHHMGIRSAALHVLGDLLGSVGVVAGAVVILLTGWTAIDPLVSILVGAIIVAGAWRILKEALDIFMERTPGHLDLAEVVRSMYHVAGVRDVHDLHIWTIAPDLHALSCHLEVADQPISDAAAVLTSVNRVLETRFNIGHSTIQLEIEGCDPNELYCTLSPDGADRSEHTVAEHALHGHRH